MTHRTETDTFGPIDVAMLPIGAYEPRWMMSSSHMSPEESLQALALCGAGLLVLPWPWWLRTLGLPLLLRPQMDFSMWVSSALGVLLGLGLFCGSLLVYSVNPASLFAAKESWSLARISMRAFGPLVMLVVGMACARLAHELR